MAAPMRYFFHVYDDDVGLDEEGSDLSGPDAAHQTAVETARVGRLGSEVVSLT